jgi:hypothetical protein
MSRWEYCEAFWRPDVVELTIPTPDEIPAPTTYPAAQWLQVLAQLGDAGWELVSCTPSAGGDQEFYFYFKRALEP